MSDIVELERRISAALGRIEAGIGPLELAQPVDENAPSSDQLAAIQVHLEEERMVNAQLEERVRLLKERQDKTLAMLEQKATQQQLMISSLDTETQSLRQSNAELREIGDQMRAALNEAVA
ncbi:MAG: hypothetical protein JKX69_12105, partial [Rhodobacteraceae bacterium]|nr:hypothetical protein [Paracoccaceae bacterium]